MDGAFEFHVGCLVWEGPVARLGLSFLAVALISIAVTAAAAWDRNGSWTSAKLTPVLDLAARSGYYTEIRDLHGDVAAVSRGFDGQPAQDEAAQAIVVRGRQVGDVAVRFTRPAPTWPCGPPCCGPSRRPPGWRRSSPC